MKSIFFSLVFCPLLSVNAQTLCVIDDPDGYANVRNGGGNSSEIIDRIYVDEIFYYDGYGDDEWYEIYYRKNGNYATGFLHKSRIKEISLLQKIGTTKKTNQSVIISNDTLKFEISIKKFE